jgi:hypothetical protein
LNGYDDFIERLEAALADDEAREEFLDYLQGLTGEGRAEILAEADRREAASPEKGERDERERTTA